MATKMTSGAKIGLIIGAILLLFILWLASAYNNLVKTDENATQAWAQVENAYQRRADLIPNLVKTVKGAANFEKGTLESVIRARAEATSVKIDPTNLNEVQRQLSYLAKTAQKENVKGKTFFTSRIRKKL